MSKVRQNNENKLKQYLNGHNKPTPERTNNSSGKPQADKNSGCKR